MHILIGLAVLAAGMVLVIKSEWFLSNFGRIEWFESHLATSGGSRMGYKLVGLGAIFIGMMIMTNLIGGIITWVFSPLFR